MVCNGLLMAQTTSQTQGPTPDIRIEISKQGANLQLEQTCFVTYPNNRFHLESRKQPLNAGKPTVKLYEGSLEEDSLQRLVALVNTPQFRELKPLSMDQTEDTSGGLDALLIEVFRSDGQQHLTYLTAAQRSQYEKTLEPIETWFSDFIQSLEKSKVAPLESGSATRCAFGPGKAPQR